MRGPHTAHVQDIALGTLTEWMPGYYVDGESPQIRVRTYDVDDDSVVFVVEEGDQYPSGGRHRFRVTVTVEPVDEEEEA